MAGSAAESETDASAAPGWFADFLVDGATRKPSKHTMKAYRQDFTAVADLLAAVRKSSVALTDIMKKEMRTAFHRLRLHA